MPIKTQDSDYEGVWGEHDILVRSTTVLRIRLMPATTLWELYLNGDKVDEMEGRWLSGKIISMMGKLKTKNNELVKIYIETRKFNKKKNGVVAKVADKKITLDQNKAN